MTGYFPGRVCTALVHRSIETDFNENFIFNAFIHLPGFWRFMTSPDSLSDSCKEVSQVLLYIDVENEQPKTKQTSLWPYNLKPNGIHKITLITDGVGRVDRMEGLNASTIWFHASDESFDRFPTAAYSILPMAVMIGLPLLCVRCTLCVSGIFSVLDTILCYLVIESRSKDEDGWQNWLYRIAYDRNRLRKSGWKVRLFLKKNL